MKEKLRGIEEREAKWGQKMIEVKVRFWTNGLAVVKGNIKPMYAKGSGVVRIKKNRAHGITPGRPIHFRSLMDLPAKIEKLLIQEGILIRRSRQMHKYIS